jgi:hypothetical protein
MIVMSVILAAALAALGALGVIVLALAIHREEKAYSLTTSINDRVARGARVACGVYTRIPERLSTERSA